MKRRKAEEFLRHGIHTESKGNQQYEKCIRSLPIRQLITKHILISIYGSPLEQISDQIDL